MIIHNFLNANQSEASDVCWIKLWSTCL